MYIEISVCIQIAGLFIPSIVIFFFWQWDFGYALQRYFASHHPFSINIFKLTPYIVFELFPNVCCNTCLWIIGDFLTINFIGWFARFEWRISFNVWASKAHNHDSWINSSSKCSMSNFSKIFTQIERNSLSF